MDQGKRKQQIQDSEKYLFYALSAMTVLIIGIAVGRII